MSIAGSSAPYIKHWKPVPLITGLLMVLLVMAGCDPLISDEARLRFKNRSGPFAVTVFPIHIIAGSQMAHDEDLARRLVEFLAADRLAIPKMAAESIYMPAYYGISETKRIRLSARHFQRAIDHIDLSTEYAFMAEIIFNRQKTRIIGVYFYLADRFGRIASARMADAHHQKFQQIHPTDREDGLRILTQMLREGWLSHPAGS